jgi:hypothetical protein
MQAEKEMRAREEALREQKRSMQVMMAEIQRRDEEVDRKTKVCEQRVLNVSSRASIGMHAARGLYPGCFALMCRS